MLRDFWSRNYVAQELFHKRTAKLWLRERDLALTCVNVTLRERDLALTRERDLA